MADPQWQNLKEIFHAAIGLPPAERVPYLDKACDGDLSLRAAIESLLKAHEESGFMDMPAYEAAANMLVEGAENADGSDGAGNLIAGQIFGRYQILSLLGEGGMGRVYLAEDTRLHRKVSLKFLSKAVTSDHEKLLRFEQEARAASALNHPNILTIYEFGEENGQQFIATEYIEGETLREHQTSSLDIDDALEIAIQIASALVAAHRVHIIHRDIKPENIMIRKDDGLAKVLDFGLAKILTPRTPATTINGEAPTRFKTGPGVVMGTVAYMSPEQARGDKVDDRTDIWSLGVVLYEMITGSTPFAAGTSNEIVSAILSKQPTPPVARFSPDVPERLQEIVDKALTKNPDERYQNGKDLLIDLKRLKQSLELKASIERTSSPEKGVAGTQSGKTVAGRGPLPTSHPTSSAEYIVNQVKSHKRGVLVTFTLLLLAIATGVLIYTWRLRITPASSQPITSIAVLPFVNASNDPNTEYLSDGISESLTDRLSQLPQLKVIARSSAFRYKGKDVDPQEVAHVLGVQAVVLGRIMQRGDQLQVRAELVDARDKTQMWGEQYSRKTADLQAVQEEMARTIAEKLQLRLTGAQEQRLVKRLTENPDAYQLFLKGRYFWNKRTEEGFKKGIEYFQQAVDRDPNYALAYAGIAECHNSLGVFQLLPPNEVLPKAKAAAERALASDDTLAEAHAAMAHIALYDWNWLVADKEFKRSIELNPNYAQAHLAYGNYFLAMGRFREAIAEKKRAQELDPLSLIINAGLGWAFYISRQYDEAIDQCRKTLEMDPNFQRAHHYLGMAYAQKRMSKEAVDEFQKARALGETPETLAWLGTSYALAGERNEAQKVLGELEEVSKRRYVSPHLIAEVYATLGENDRTFEWLEKAYQEHAFLLIYLKAEPKFDSVRSDPRFINLLRRIGLPQ